MRVAPLVSAVVGSEDRSIADKGDQPWSILTDKNEHSLGRTVGNQLAENCKVERRGEFGIGAMPANDRCPGGVGQPLG